MNWKRIGLGVLGVGCFIVGFAVPPLAIKLYPAGAYFLGVATRTPGHGPLAPPPTAK